MPVTLGARPEHGFDQPLGLLSDCHRRIERFLDVLLHVVERAGGGPLSEEQRRAVETALTYFNTAGPRHNADEEESLFPMLRESQQAEAKSALNAVEALEHDHAAANVSHAEIERLYRQWIDGQALDADRARQLAQTLRDLREMYRRHIAIEDREIFPLAAKTLTAEQLSHLGTDMARRRGLTPSGK